MQIPRKDLTIQLLVFIVGVASLVTLWQNAIALTATTIALYLILNLLQRKNDLLLYIIAAIIGPVMEIFAINAGIWRYSELHFLGIPVWLPFGWGIMAVLIARISESLFGNKH